MAHISRDEIYTRVKDNIFIKRRLNKSSLYDVVNFQKLSPTFEQIIEDSGNLFFIDSANILLKRITILGTLNLNGEVLSARNVHTGEVYDVKCSEEYLKLKENLSKFKLQRKIKTYKKR